MHDTFDIRPVEPRDVPQAAQIMVAARHASVPAIPPPVHSDDEIRGWFAEHVINNYDVWVAAEEGAVVGVLVLSEGWIEHLYLDPSETGRGIGSKLVDHAKRMSHGELRLWTFVNNVGAQRIYERHGFVEIGRTDGDNEEGAPDINYRWRRAEEPTGRSTRSDSSLRPGRRSSLRGSGIDP